METNRRCRSCGKTKPLATGFPRDLLKGKTYYRRICRACRASATRSSRAASAAAFIERAARRLIKKRHGQGVRVSITVDQIVSLWEKQRGLCALSGVAMTHTLGWGDVPTNISIDRIVNSRGYVPSNVQLVCRAVNSMKSKLSPDEFSFWCQQVARQSRRRA